MVLSRGVRWGVALLSDSCARDARGAACEGGGWGGEGGCENVEAVRGRG